MKIPIEITQSHIDAGEGHAGEYNKCPVAVYLYELGFDEVNVDEDVIKFSWKGKPLVFKTPRKIDLFIDDFDNNRPIKPFTDELTTQVLPPTPNEDD